MQSTVIKRGWQAISHDAQTVLDIQKANWRNPQFYVEIHNQDAKPGATIDLDADKARVSDVIEHFNTHGLNASLLSNANVIGKFKSPPFSLSGQYIPAQVRVNNLDEDKVNWLLDQGFCIGNTYRPLAC